MLHQQTLQIVQTGFKYFFDVDPSLTEHMFRNLAFQATILSSGAAKMISDCSDKFGDIISPMIHEIRNLRLSIPGF